MFSLLFQCLKEKGSLDLFATYLFIFFIYNYNLFFLVQRVCGVNFLKSVNKLNHCNKFPHFRLTCPRSTKDCCYNSRCLWSTVQNHPPFDVLKCLKHCWNLCMFAKLNNLILSLVAFQFSEDAASLLFFTPKLGKQQNLFPTAQENVKPKGIAIPKGYDVQVTKYSMKSIYLIQ